MLNDDLEDNEGRQMHYHYAPIRGVPGFGDYEHEDTVEWGPTSSLMITGGGKNKSMIRDDGGFSEGDVLWSFDGDPDESENILEI